MTDSNKIKDIETYYNEAYSGWWGWQEKAEEDDKFYMSEQWNADDRAFLEDSGRPVITINNIKKAVDLICGYQRQNRLDIKYYPIEGNDVANADFLSEIVKWSTDNADATEYIAYAFGDAIRTGKGWFLTRLDYSKDFVNGDIKVELIDKYHILPDPYFKNPYINEDCDYIVRYAWPQKERVAETYPAHKKDIRKISPGLSSLWTKQQPQTNIQDRGERVNLVEVWYKEWVKVTYLIDPNDPRNAFEWTGGKKRLRQFKEQRPDLANQLAIVTIRQPRIKLLTQMEGKILLHDGDPPMGYSKTQFPFVPIFCYFVPTFHDWSVKLQGIVRTLKDPQREYNKFRSLMMDAAMTVPDSGVYFETDAYASPEEANKTGAGVKIELNPGGLAKIRDVEPKQPNAMLMTLHEYCRNDIREIGPNTDLLGMSGQPGGSSADASGTTISLRQRQGLISLQNPFDGLKLAYKQFGTLIKELIDTWPVEKLQRIVGENRQIPPGYMRYKNSYRYDCKVDDTTHNTTYRLAGYSQLRDFVQHGGAVPPEIMREMSLIPDEVKQRWQQIEMQNVQQSQQQRQIENQIELAKIQASQQGLVQASQIQAEGALAREQVDQKGAMTREHLKRKKELELKEMDIRGKMLIEKIRQNQRRIAGFE